jgi:integrase
MNRPRKHDKHLPRNVYFRHGMHYYVKGGKWTPIGRTVREAMAKYANIYEGSPGSMAALIAKAMPFITAGKKPNTANQYRIAGKKLAAVLEEFRPEDVTHATIEKMMEKMGDTPNMANRCLSVLRRVFSYAAKHDFVTMNPVIGVGRHKEQKRVRLLTLEELAAIYTASGPRLRIIIDLLLRTGQRVGDVLKIRRADLLDDGIRFEQQKTGAKLIVPWNPELREVVKRAKAMHSNIRALTLLHNRRGKTPDYRTVREQWDKACLAAKVTDAHLHDLRAMSATWAKRQGLNATMLLGHTSPMQTVRYLRDRDAAVAEGPSFGQSKDLLDGVKENG